MLVDQTEVVKTFEENGYAVLQGLIPDSDVAAISEEIDRIITRRADYVPEHAIVYEPGTSPPRVRNVFHIHKYHPFFLEVARHPKITSVVEGIMGRPLRLYSSSLFAKPAEVGTSVPLHQDMAYWPFKPYELVSCWIALDDSTIENGCVRFLARSHKLGLLRHTPSGVPGNSLGLQDCQVKGLEERPVEVRRGSFVLHHCLTAHRSEPNRSSHPRRGLVYIYMSPRVKLTDPTQIKGIPDFPVIGAEDK